MVREGVGRVQQERREACVGRRHRGGRRKAIAFFVLAGGNCRPGFFHEQFLFFFLLRPHPALRRYGASRGRTRIHRNEMNIAAYSSIVQQRSTEREEEGDITTRRREREDEKSN